MKVSTAVSKGRKSPLIALVVIVVVIAVLEYFRLGPIGLVGRFKVWQANRAGAA